MKLTQLETCSASAHLKLGLRLNPNKSAVIQFTVTSGRDRVEDLTLLCLQVSNGAIKLSRTIQSLGGVTLDTKLSFARGLTNVYRLRCGHIRALRPVRASLSDDVASTVACSIVGSIDYCNSLLAGTSKSNSVKLERVQNTLAPRQV